MAPILKKGMRLVLAGLLLFCFMLGCTNSKTTKTTKSATGATQASPSTVATEEQEQPKAWGEETRENLIKGSENP
jgi:hypothetical protein